MDPQNVVTPGQPIQAAAGTTPAPTTPHNAPGGGQQPASGDTAQADKTFTQAELDAILSERLARQKAQFKDYDDYREKAAKWAQFEESQKSEAQKRAEELEKAKRERDEVMQKAQTWLVRAAFIAEAAKVGASHPEDVYALADRANITIDESGAVLGVADAVKAVVDAGRVPLRTTEQAPRPTPPAMNASAGVGQRPEPTATDALTDEELAVARKLGLSPDMYAAQKKAMKESRR